MNLSGQGLWDHGALQASSPRLAGIRRRQVDHLFLELSGRDSFVKFVCLSESQEVQECPPLSPSLGERSWSRVELAAGGLAVTHTPCSDMQVHRRARALKKLAKQLSEGRVQLSSKSLQNYIMPYAMMPIFDEKMLKVRCHRTVTLHVKLVSCG